MKLEIESKIHQYSPTYFCHNDLHNGNILKTDQGIKIIDFDRASYGYRAYDFVFWLTWKGHA